MSDDQFYNYQTVLDAVPSRIDELIQHLLPNARKQAGCYRIAALNGERGTSLSISTKSNNAGCYHDFQDEAIRGNAIGLWAEVKGCSYKEAGAALAAFLGVSPEQRLHIPKKRPQPKITREENGISFLVGVNNPRTEQVLPLNAKSIAYAESRGISRETLKAARCRSTPTHIIFPHFDEEMNPVLFKCWSCDGQKSIYTNNDPIPVLFGKHLIDPVKSGSTLIICEGQWDALTWIQLGYPAVSIPSGVSNDEWIGEDWAFLNCFSEIYLDFDSDGPGREGEMKARARLGAERCRSIQYRYKDANDALMKADSEALIEAFRHARDAPIERLINPSLMKSKVKERLNKSHVVGGVPFFLPSLPFEFRPHEITVWFGITSHGKALPLDTFVPTPHGHRAMRDLKTGDWVYGSDGKPTLVIATSEIFQGNDCYEIEFRDRLKVVADGGHLWRLDTVNSRAAKSRTKKRVYTDKVNYRQGHKMNNGVVMTTEELFNSDLMAMVGKRARPNFSIPIAPAFDGVHTDLPIPPYTLGAWLGDGASANANITNHPDDHEIIKRIEADGFVVEKKKPKYLHLIKGLQVLLRKTGLLQNKHIPEEYFHASKEQRMELLRGLMDTDGTISNGRQCEFCSVKEHFAHQVQRLANGLGIKACMNIGNASLNGRVIGKKYRVQWTNAAKVFHLSRKLDRLPETVGPDAMRRTIIAVRKVESVPTKCIVVDATDHLFLCTENCIITHNSTLLSNQICYAASRGKMCMVASFEQATPMTMSGMLVQYTSDQHIGQHDDFDEAYDELTRRVMFFDSMVRANPDDLIATMTIAHKQMGVEEFVVDNGMTLDVDRQDNTAQAAVADKLRVFAAQYPVVLHIVLHPRKPPPSEASKPPSTADIMGASEWAAMAHNIICVWRDVAKSQRLSEMRDEGMDPGEIMAFDESCPDGKVFIRKQRDSGDLPMTSYRFDKETKRAWKTFDDMAPYWAPGAIHEEEEEQE